MCNFTDLACRPSGVSAKCHLIEFDSDSIRLIADLTKSFLQQLTVDDSGCTRCMIDFDDKFTVSIISRQASANPPGTPMIPKDGFDIRSTTSHWDGKHQAGEKNTHQTLVSHTPHSALSVLKRLSITILLVIQSARTIDQARLHLQVVAVQVVP